MGDALWVMHAVCGEPRTGIRQGFGVGKEVQLNDHSHHIEAEQSMSTLGWFGF